jgi:hypothetical protein
MSDQTVFDDFWQALAYTGPFAWAQAPYLILMIANLFRLFNKITLLVVSGIITIFGIAVLVDGLYFHIDAQNALLFLIVPVYQAGAAVVGIILALVFGRIKSARK